MGSFDAILSAIRVALGARTIYVVNSLDQDVTIQIKGNRAKSTENSADVGGSFTVPAGKADFRTLVVDQSGVLPFLYLELSCSTPPSSGSVDVYLIRGVLGETACEDKIVDALEIRDTNVHDPSTDPDKIKIVGWW